MTEVDVKLSDGTVVTVKPLTVGEVISNKASDNEMRSLKLVAAAVVKVNGEKKKLDPIKDISKWIMGDFTKVLNEVMRISGLEESEVEIKK